MPKRKLFRILIPLCTVPIFVSGISADLSQVRAFVAGTPDSDQKRVLTVLPWMKESQNAENNDRTYRQTLREQLGEQLDYYTEYLDVARFTDESYEAALRDFLRRKYEGKKFDLIIATNFVMGFLSRYARELFPGTPVVYASYPDLYLGSNFFAAVVEPPFKYSMETALALQPNIKRVYVISGASELDRQFEVMARRQFQQFGDRCAFTYLSGTPLPDLLQTVAKLPPDSIIYMLMLTQDGQGNKFDALESLDIISAKANVPIYSFYDLRVGHGIVGGRVFSQERGARLLAQAGLRILNGERPATVSLDPAQTTVTVFDWRQLRRWGISEASLPPGSEVRFKELTFWQQYKGRIVVTAAIIILQTILLAGLLVERRQKRRASRRLSESEERFAKAFKANPQPMSLTTLAEGRYLDVNESFLLMSGFTRQEVIGHSSLELQCFENPAHRNTVLVGPLLEHGVVRNFELRFRTRGGEVKILLSSAELIELAGEKCILVASSDFTERKRLEQELERSEKEFSTLVENSPDIICRLDSDLRYIYVSPGLAHLGLSPDQLLGKTPREIGLGRYDWDSFESSCHEAYRSRQTIHRTFEYGGRSYWTRIVPESNADGVVESLMAISQDVTERVRTERELMQLTAQLFRLQDEERRRIARELHDGTAQNLFAISINLAKLRQLDETQKHEMHHLIAECTTLGDQSLQEIRTLSYLLHPPLLDQVGLLGALKWYVEGFAKRSGIYVDLYTQPIDRLPSDVELALFRIVQESLTNVLRHSGSETVSVRLQEIANEISLEIQDQGRGINGSRSTGTANESTESIQMGVGIAGMRQRLHQLGGRLEVTSNSQGTTITAVVPVASGGHHVANSARGRS